MPNPLPKLYCPNIRCQALYTFSDQVCQECGTTLPLRYLWVVGPHEDKFEVGSLLRDRYLFCGPRVALDTRPGIPLKADLELPDHVLPYLKLFPLRLHIPQVYTLLASQADDRGPILLLEQAPLCTADWTIEMGGDAPDMPTDDTDATVFSTPEFSSQPLMAAWPYARPLRQLHWLWQLAQLWQPLYSQGVATSLLLPHLIRVEGPLVRLLELESDVESEPTLADLGQLWQSLLPLTSGELSPALAKLCERLTSGKIAFPDQLVLQLAQWIDHAQQAYQIEIDIATRTDTGHLRNHNEDACYPEHSAVLCNTSERIAIVCDGVGGHAGGEIAAGIAIDALKSHLTQLPEDNLLPQDVIGELEKATFVANDLISQQNDAEQRQERQRMGTTLIMAFVQAYQLYIAHIGDSRAYLITTTGCYQVTMDDDIASREVRLGYVPYREALLQPGSGALIQALGMGASTMLRPSAQQFILDEDCVFLLCSDGLSDFDRVEALWKEDILPLLHHQTDLATVSDRLIENANTLNGHDNVTVALVHCRVTPSTEDKTELEPLTSPATIPLDLAQVHEEQQQDTVLKEQPLTSSPPNWLQLLSVLVLLGVGGVLLVFALPLRSRLPWPQSPFPRPTSTPSLTTPHTTLIYAFPRTEG